MKQGGRQTESVCVCEREREGGRAKGERKIERDREREYLSPLSPWYMCTRSQAWDCLSLIRKVESRQVQKNKREKSPEKDCLL